MKKKKLKLKVLKLVSKGRGKQLIGKHLTLFRFSSIFSQKLVKKWDKMRKNRNFFPMGKL